MQYRRPPRRFTREALDVYRRRYEETDEPQSSIAADMKVHRKTLDRIAKEEGWTLRKDRPPSGLPKDLGLLVKAERAVEAMVCPLPNPPPQGGREQEEPEAGRGAACCAPTNPPQGGREQAAASGEEPESHSPREAAARDDPSIHRAEELEREIDGLLADVKRARALGPLSSADAERTARTLERLTDTLFKVQRLRSVEAGAAATDDFDDIPQDIDEFRHALARRIEAFVESWSDAGLPEQGEPSDRASA